MVAPPAAPASPPAHPADDNDKGPPGETLSATLWLGRAFSDISQDGPTETFNAAVLLKHLKTDNPIVLLDKNLSPKKASNLTPSRIFSVPNNVDLHTETSTGQGDLAVYHSGQEVNHAFQTDASFSASYLGVTVSGSTSYSYKTQYTDDQQYAFTSSSVTSYAAEITNIAQFLNPFVRKFAIGLPQWSEDLKVVQAYYEFFRIFGTHVVTIVYSGWRIQVQIQAENTSNHAQEDFSVNVSAKYLSNSVDVSVKTSSSYDSFNKSSTSNSVVYGGKPSDIGALTDLPFPPEARKRWDDAVGTRPDDDVIQIGATEIGVLLQQVPDDAVIQKVGSNLISALSFITQRRTTVRLQKHSDFATFQVLSDGIVMVVKESPTVIYDANSHSIQYGIPAAQGGTFTNDYASKTFLEFSIFNNGQPIDILIGHGALQDTNDKGSNGTCRFVVFDGSGPDGHTYPNQTVPQVQASNPLTVPKVAVNSRVDWWNA